MRNFASQGRCTGDQMKTLTDVFLAGRMTKPDYDRDWQDI
jgi:hypothetical protein